MDNQPQPPPLPTQPLPERHGCLTAWLVFIIVVNAATAVLTPATIDGMKRAGLPLAPLSIGVMILGSIANIAFAIALFRWQKWGFYGVMACSVVALISNLSAGLGIAKSLIGLAGIAILYWVLNMGEENKAWPRLK